MSTALVVALALGQILAMIFALNTSHGLGANLRWMDRAVLAVIFAFGLIGGGIVWTVWGLAWWDWPLAIRLYSIPCIALALLGLPAVTILRARRRPATGATLVRSEIRDLRGGIETSELVGTGIRARLLALPFNDALKIRTAHWSVRIAGLPPALDGLSILHLTDLHLAPAYGSRFFEEAIQIALASGSEPDLVAITGDFIDDDDAIAWIDPILGRLRGRFGQFAILGNHDYRHDFRESPAGHYVVQGSRRWKAAGRP